jgi:hypothetical protein
MTDIIEATNNTDFQAWLDYGAKQGWCSPAVLCQTHDGVPMTPEEDEEFNEGGDPCIHVIRFFTSKEEQEAAIANSPHF